MDIIIIFRFNTDMKIKIAIPPKLFGIGLFPIIPFLAWEYELDMK